MLGQLAYYMKGLEKLPGFKPFALKMKAPDLVIEEQVMLFLIANSNSVGGFEKLAPSAKLDDGLFDVFVLRQCNLAEFIRIVTLAMRGEHLDDPLVIHFQTNSLELSAIGKIQLISTENLAGRCPDRFRSCRDILNVSLTVPGMMQSVMT